ncbi:hypothetical protein CMV24_18920 [Pseudomonas plecoglossicida]|uniref:GIY-YIG domain-containing protein n=3 Tax=Pseudomonas TaxID=286 RepID=A0A7W2PTU8_9PSED|nr:MULTISPECIES: hypothetical protein [Pseudomonas]MCT8191201.1 hypothetical protein [Pseudomonas monteilii]AGZ38071.1 hypothetical protein PVLB_26672 [Pseudomonas sp. VLB120]EKT4481195.1 hypothetical protein [Pseudomonas putida]MBA6060561.1 hypothetical protein [Pseudomonas juntendi]MDH0760415.1 hypothetical protein [Pseudomonas juntendi]
MNTQEQLRHYEATMISAPRRVLAGHVDWKKDITRDAGVYVIWKGQSPVYVGESSALRARMSDLTNFKNHSFAKKTCALFGLCASDKKGLISTYSSNYELSFCAIPFGRKEVEEYLILRWRSTLSNKETARQLAGPQYSWVEPAPPFETETGITADIQELLGSHSKGLDVEFAEAL